MPLRQRPPERRVRDPGQPNGWGSPPWQQHHDWLRPWIHRLAEVSTAPRRHQRLQTRPPCWPAPAGRTDGEPTACSQWWGHPEAEAGLPLHHSAPEAPARSSSRAPEGLPGAPATGHVFRLGCHRQEPWPAPQRRRHRDATPAQSVPGAPCPQPPPAGPSDGSAASRRPPGRPSPRTTSVPGIPTTGTRKPSSRFHGPEHGPDPVPPPGPLWQPFPNSCR